MVCLLLEKARKDTSFFRYLQICLHFCRATASKLHVAASCMPWFPLIAIDDHGSPLITINGPLITAGSSSWNGRCAYYHKLFTKSIDF